MRSCLRTIACCLALLVNVAVCLAQNDTIPKPKHHLSASTTSWTRGEVRSGALPKNGEENYAAFLMGSTVLRLEYDSPWLDVRFSPKYFGVWGSSANGNMGVEEAWFTLKKGGFFARLGRQKLSYDDQRIIGDDDWAMAPKTHDVLKTGFEGGRHKVHLLLAFNQNNENLDGGTYYVSGGQAYKTMQTLWYHYDPFPWLGASLIGMNMGMQCLRQGEQKTNFQQIFGAYADFHPRNFTLQASYYRQTGKTEYSLPIHAWMTSAESAWQMIPSLGVNAGYFYMSGDPLYFVPPEGAFGMALKTEASGFNPMFGSHHQFYGAMDFFYVTTFYGGNTPGLQDLHLGVKWNPHKKVTLEGKFHYLATSVAIEDVGKTLGHEMEASVAWQIAKDVNLQAGYTFMDGTDTMSRLKRSSDKNHLRWGWIMMLITPEFFRL